MERSDRLIKFVTAVVFVALVIYGGFSLYSTRDDSLETAVATAMELRESVSSEGWAVREETVLTAPSGTSIMVAEGEKVSAGTNVAIIYETAEDLRRAEEIRELTATIAALEAISGETNIRDAAKNSVLELSRVITERELASIDAAALDISAYVLETGEVSAETALESLDGMKTRLESLRITAEGRGTVTAASSGVFSSNVDGYEYIRPADISGKLTPSQVNSLFSGATSVRQGAFGKLIHGIRWYYVTILDTSWASLIAGRTTVEVEFSKSYNGNITMTVESVGLEENGKCAVVLSSTRYLSQIAGVRELTGEIILRAASGIRIPREAVHLNDEGTTIVYVLEGIQAKAVTVSILGEDGDYYMVSPEGELRSGNQVITKADYLADGAVVLRDRL